VNFKENVIRELFYEQHNDVLFSNKYQYYQIAEHRFNRALEQLNYPNNKTIIEIGPFPGAGLYFFGENNKVIGIGKDSSGFSKKFKNSGGEFIEMDFEKRKINESLLNKADILLVQEVIEHIRQHYSFLKNILNYLKKDGILYLTTNNIFYSGYILKLMLGKNIYDSIKSEIEEYPGHTRYYDYYDYKELSQVLEDLNLEIVSSGRLNMYPPYYMYNNQVKGILKNLTIKLFPKRYSTHIEIIAKK